MLGRCCCQLRPVFNPGAFKGGAELAVDFCGDGKGLGELRQQQNLQLRVKSMLGTSQMGKEQSLPQEPAPSASARVWNFILGVSPARLGAGGGLSQVSPSPHCPPRAPVPPFSAPSPEVVAWRVHWTLMEIKQLQGSTAR